MMKKLILITVISIFTFSWGNIFADDTATAVQTGIGVLGNVLDRVSKSKDKKQQAAQENKEQNQMSNEQNVSMPVFGGNPVVLGENEGKASATVRSITTAIETYAVSNGGQYPTTGDEVTQYISSFETYNNKTVDGYHYFVKLGKAYKIVAKPTTCGTTGTKNFVGTNGDITEEECK